VPVYPGCHGHHKVSLNRPRVCWVWALSRLEPWSLPS
jgi:hypothetical protein